MFNNIFSLFFNSNCPLCQRSSKNIICEYCEQKLIKSKLSHHNYYDEDYLLFAWGKYDEYLKRSIATFKYDQKREIGELLGYWLGKAWIKANYQRKYPQLTVIPIPLHPEKEKIRGFNQAELIARSFCDTVKYPLKTNLLKRVKNTEAMFGLTPEKRKENINQAFVLGKDYQKIDHEVTLCVRRQQILIIDDIYTTGVTVKEAMKVLIQGKLKPIGVATISLANQNIITNTIPF